MPADPQHPDIAALVEELGGYAKLLRMLHPKQNEKSAALVDRTIAALRTLARPVEDEEAAKWLRRFNAYGGEFEEAASLIASLAREKASAEQEAERLRADMERISRSVGWYTHEQVESIARHAIGELNTDASAEPCSKSAPEIETREKASAEQEAARLRDLLRSVLRMAVLHAYSPDGSAENKAVVADAERALAAAAGAEG